MDKFFRAARKRTYTSRIEVSFDGRDYSVIAIPSSRMAVELAQIAITSRPSRLVGHRGATIPRRSPRPRRGHTRIQGGLMAKKKSEDLYRVTGDGKITKLLPDLREAHAEITQGVWKGESLFIPIEARGRNGHYRVAVGDEIHILTPVGKDNPKEDFHLGSVFRPGESIVMMLSITGTDDNPLGWT